MQFLLLRRSCRDDIGLLRCGIFNKRKGAEESGSHFSFSQGQGVANRNNNRVVGKPEAIQKRASGKLPERRVVESQVALVESSICNRITFAKMGTSKPDCFICPPEKMAERFAYGVQRDTFSSPVCPPQESFQEGPLPINLRGLHSFA